MRWVWVYLFLLPFIWTQEKQKDCNWLIDSIFIMYNINYRCARKVSVVENPNEWIMFCGDIHTTFVSQAINAMCGIFGWLLWKTVLWKLKFVAIYWKIDHRFLWKTKWNHLNFLLLLLLSNDCNKLSMVNHVIHRIIRIQWFNSDWIDFRLFNLPANNLWFNWISLLWTRFRSKIRFLETKFISTRA